ncbi:MAG TPA: sigma-70 family RNA polymerase sigma factor [Mucilaginibacter sp.]|nr:sigma-70 family RNA polymerase sigma factor [Mucilaginibacter sp.]
MEQQELIPHLFRTEYRKIVSVLCKRFGLREIEAAEDIASDTFMTAVHTWPSAGIPPNPVAWLHNVAKNKTKNYLHRQGIFNDKVTTAIHDDVPPTTYQEIDLSAGNIQDSQLQMMFAICQPSIPVESQIALSLRILCGFGIDEIADAFLVNKETINKRLLRAKEKLRNGNVSITFPAGSEIAARLDTVLTTIYLLFSEGYYSTADDRMVRKELCAEAMRLCYMLIENTGTNQPRVNALMALMCFHSSRLDARISAAGELILYDDQDRNLWNKQLISRGAHFLKSASRGSELSKYHLEASIAYWNTCPDDSAGKWPAILHLYDLLLQMEYSAMAALNRAFALSKVHGKEEVIDAANAIDMAESHFYHTLLGELYTGIDNNKAGDHFRRALLIAKNHLEKLAISKKLGKLTV